MSATLRTLRSPLDLEAMSALASGHDVDALHRVDLPYRLCSWALDWPENTALWHDAGGTLLAWASMQTPFWTVDYACRQDAAADLYPTLLEWADDRARAIAGAPAGHPSWFVMVYADMAACRRDLEAAGWACLANVPEDAWSEVLLERPASLVMPQWSVPDGYSISPLAGESEVQAYVDLHRRVFGTSNMTIEWRSRTLLRPERRPDCDLVAVAPDGALAAFCIGWLGARAQPTHGHIEPLGVDEPHRGRGLGRAILCETVSRLHAAGATSVSVFTDDDRSPALGLYDKVGFTRTQDILVYRKDYT